MDRGRSPKSFLGKITPTGEAGFSLIELMITVSLIGVLASMGQANLSRFTEKAKRNRAIAEMAAMSTMVIGHRQTEDKALGVLTGHYCTWCAMGGGIWPSGGTEMPGANGSAQGLVTFGIMGHASVPRDPWGRVYVVDENEQEAGNGDCRYDAIWSAGEDGLWEGWSGDSCFGDDVIFRIPSKDSHPVCVLTSFMVPYSATGCM